MEHGILLYNTLSTNLYAKYLKQGNIMQETTFLIHTRSWTIWYYM